MSSENVHTIIDRAATDPAYLELLLSDPGKALAGYELTDAESVVLRDLSADDFKASAAQLEAQIANDENASSGIGEEGYKRSSSEKQRKLTVYEGELKQARNESDAKRGIAEAETKLARSEADAKRVSQEEKTKLLRSEEETKRAIISEQNKKAAG